MYSYAHPGFSGVIGVARADITPPVGIYARSWGAAVHDVAEGIHKPLTLTALTLQETSDSQPLVLVAADLGWWRDPSEEKALRESVLQALNLDAKRLMVNFSHTHAGPVLCREDADKPGGEFIPAYLDQLRDTLISTIREALENAMLASLEFTYGRCGLATNRDLLDPNGERFICGFRPDVTADDTLLIGRVTDADGKIHATLVNYACHPTTLAWENRLISPDYIGAMRETVEAQIGGLCLFLQGASGELAPRQQYTGDIAIPDGHGRTLGYAVLSTLQGMLPPGTRFEYKRTVESGAPLAIWETTPAAHADTLEATQTTLDMALKPEWQGETEEEHAWAASGDLASLERLRRRRRVRLALGGGTTAPVSSWVWRVGDTFILGHPGEAYSILQTELRATYPNTPMVITNVTNGWGGYLPPITVYSQNIYPVWQTPFAAGCLERLMSNYQDTLKEMLPAKQGQAGS